jgi:hypothetical protein
MDINDVPEPFKTRVEDLYFGADVTGMVNTYIADASDWDEARNNIFNDFQNQIDEARKAQNFFCKE